MRQLDDLQESLARRYRQLVNSRWQNLDREAQYTAEWIARQPRLTAIITEAGQVEEPPSLAEWLDQCIEEDGVIWPTETVEGQVVLSWNLLSGLQLDQARDLVVQIYNRSGLGHPDDMVQRFVEEALSSFQPVRLDGQLG